MEPESPGTLDSWKSMGISVNQCHMANGAFPINLQVGVLLQKCLKLNVQVSFRTIQNLLLSIKWGGCSFRNEIGATPKKMKETAHSFEITNEITSWYPILNTFCRQTVNYLWYDSPKCNPSQPTRPPPRLRNLWTLRFLGIFWDGKGREDWKLVMYKL